MSDVRLAYDTVAVSYAEVVGTAIDDRTEHPADIARLDAFCGALRGADLLALDAGCGPGRAAARLLSQGLPCLGVDLSPGMLGAGRRAHPAVPLVAGDLAALPLRDASMCGAVSWYSTIHTAPEDLALVLAELARVVVAGGPLLVAFQAGDGQPRRREAAYGHPVTLTSWRHDPACVGSLLRSSGWRVTDLAVRPPARDHETSDQAFVSAVRA